ncbi:MAG: hypothetical protein AB8B69_05725 [Chitinophagales bacterium]
MNNLGFSPLLICFLISILFSCNSPEPGNQNTIPTSTSNATEAEITPQKNATKNASSLEEKTKIIRNLYKEVQDNLNNYTARSKPYTGELDAIVVGELTGYIAENEVVKLVDKAEEDHGPSKNEFYFVNGKLFFLFSQVSTVEMTEKPNIHVRELRLYFDENKIIDALVKTKTFKDGEKIDMSIIANKKDDSLINSNEESEYYSALAYRALEFFQGKESFDEFYGDK